MGAYSPIHHRLFSVVAIRSIAVMCTLFFTFSPFTPVIVRAEDIVTQPPLDFEEYLLLGECGHEHAYVCALWVTVQRMRGNHAFRFCTH